MYLRRSYIVPKKVEPVPEVIPEPDIVSEPIIEPLPELKIPPYIYDIMEIDDEEDNVSIISEMDCSIAPSLTRSTTSHRSATTNDEVYIINKNDLIPYNSTSEQSKKDTNYKYKIIK